MLGDNPKKQWATPMITMFTSILDKVKANKEKLPGITRNFCVENEADWQKYIKKHGKDAKQGWWGELEPKATKKKGARKVPQLKRRGWERTLLNTKSSCW